MPTITKHQRQSLVSAPTTDMLTVVKGPMTGKRFILHDDFSIGRSADAEIPLPDQCVSRKHARIYRADGLWILEDVNSHNGTHLNGQRVFGQLRLHDGDRVRVESHTFELSLEDDDSELLDMSMRFDGQMTADEINRKSAIVASIDADDFVDAHSKSQAGTRLAAVLEIARDLGGTVGLSELLPRVLDNLFRILPQAARGHLLLTDRSDGVLRLAAFKDVQESNGQFTQQTMRSFDRGLINKAMESGIAILGADVHEHDGKSIFNTPSVLCISLLDRAKRGIGAIYLEAVDDEAFTSNDLEVVSNIAVLISHSIENARLSEAHYRSVVDTAADAIITIDDLGFITTANPASEQLFGRAVAKLVRQPITLLFAPPLAVSLQQALIKSLRDGTQLPLDSLSSGIGLHCGGRQFPIAMSIGEFVEGGKRRFTLVVRDMTEHEAAQAELKRMNEELAAKNDEMTQFVYTISHDLKSPLVTCRGFVGLMREDLDDGDVDEVRTSIGRIESATKRMADLINDLLHLSRLGAVRNEPEDIDINQLVDSIATDLEERFEDARANLVVPSDLPRVTADPVRLGEIIDNLLTNAVKYGCPEAGMDVELNATVENGELRLSIRDHGPGIAPEYQDRVFSLFERLESDGDGTGVGLTIVRRIAELHGGQACIESPQDGGAEFVVTLPQP